MAKLTLLAGMAGASITALATGQALGFPGGAQLGAAGIAPEVQAVQYRYYAPYGGIPPFRYSRDGSPIDAQGWRFYNGTWHSGCFDLPYLSDVDACGGGPGGRR
jgi:hypothetical protein